MRALVMRAVLAALVPASAVAQSSSLTESQALERLEQSPRVQAARAGVDVLRADVAAAARWPNPRVTFNREAVAGVAENMVTVAQPLPITGRRGLDMQAAAARVDAASSRAGDVVRRLRADVRLAFSDLWTAQAREDELRRSHDRVSALTVTLASREAAGETAGFDRLRAERESSDVDVDRALAAADRARAQALLAGLVSQPADRLVAVRPDVVSGVSRAEAGTLPSVDELMARAEATRGDLAALRHDQDAAAFAESAARRRRIPEPEIAGGTKSSNAGDGDVGSIVSVHINVPLFDRAAPERAAARARARQVAAEADVLRTSVRAQIAAWHATLVERRAIAARYRQSAVANAGDIERIAQVSYDAGERSILELLDAYRTAAAARVRQALLDAAVREAEIELEFASGWEFR